jgi:hypothetical protein
VGGLERQGERIGQTGWEDLRDRVGGFAELNESEMLNLESTNLMA